MSDSYDPLDSLDEEVQRFKASNTFTPMHVTHFYLQAGGIIRELRHARKRIEQLEVVLSDALRQFGRWENGYAYDAHGEERYVECRIRAALAQPQEAPQ